LLQPTGGLQAQTFFVVDGVVGSSSQVRQVDAAGGISSFSTGYNLPRGLARDAVGNLYLAENGLAAGNGRITKITPADVRTVEVGGFTGGFGVVFDKDGNLYVSNDTATALFPANTIIRFTGGQGLGTVFASGFSGPRGMAFDAAGNLYVANFTGGTVSKVTPAGAVTPFVSGLSGPWGLAIDAAGTLFVANRTSRNITRVTPEGTASVVAAVGPPRPQALAFDESGTLFVAFGNGTISKLGTDGTITPFYATPADQPTPDFVALVVGLGSTPVAKPIEAWRTARFGADAGVPSIAGDLADPDGDGLQNLLEYALGSDPRVASAESLPRAGLADGLFTVSYPRSVEATDVSLTVESSATLEAFATATGFSALETEPVLGVRRVTLSFPADAVTRFVRLRVARP